MLLPVTTVSVQNAVAQHDLGTATASMNFFRSLGGAIIVAVFGTLVLGGAAFAPGGSLQHLSPEAIAALAAAFRLVFVASAAGLALALFFISAMHELPLHDRRA